MCTTNVSPTADTGSPVASMSMPALSMATWPIGSHSTRKMVAASAGMVRWTSSRSTRSPVSAASVVSPDSLVMPASWHRGGPGRAPDRPGTWEASGASEAGRSDGVVALLARAHAGHAVEGHAPDLAVADLPGAGRHRADVDDLLGLDRRDDDLEPDLGDELDGVLGAPEDLALAALAAVALQLADREAEHPRVAERFLHLLELVGLDDGGHEMGHVDPSWAARRCPAATAAMSSSSGSGSIIGTARRRARVRTPWCATYEARVT